MGSCPWRMSVRPAPPLLAGTVVAGDAEIVSALVLIQMAHPGAPVFHSFMPGVMHPRTGDYLATAWEGTLLYPIGVEMAHHWGVPTLAGIFRHRWTIPRLATAGDAASSLMLSALAGAETGAGLGLVESCKLLYPEEVILDSDIYPSHPHGSGRARYQPRGAGAGCDQSSRTARLFLKHRHTRENIRRRVFSDLANQANPSGGMRDPVEVAREKADWILNNHHPRTVWKQISKQN